MRVLVRKWWMAGMCVAACAAMMTVAAAAQSSKAAKPKPAESAKTGTSDVDGKVADVAPKSKAELTAQAWEMLTASVQDEKHPEVQVQAVGALSSMGMDAHAGRLIEGAMSAKDLQVRATAALAVEQTRNRRLIPQLRKLLNDPEPQVAFAAASALWKLGDHAGESILLAVVDGERKASASLMHGSMYQAQREMHNPAEMAKLGALEGASLLLGPFGFGVTAYEYIRKNGGDSARVTAIEMISQSRSQEVKETLLAAMKDKDVGVRASACKALRLYREPDVATALAAMFDDTKKPVQLTAAAAYLVASGAVAMPLVPRSTP